VAVLLVSLATMLYYGVRTYWTISEVGDGGFFVIREFYPVRILATSIVIFSLAFF
jgi:hypothetical protein